MFLLVVLLAVPALVDRPAAGPGRSAVPASPGEICRLEGRRSAGVRCVLMGRGIPVNRARADDFTVVPGIGPVLAARIVETRNRMGGFERLEDLMEVPGIGPKRFILLRRYLVLGSP